MEVLTLALILATFRFSEGIKLSSKGHYSGLTIKLDDSLPPHLCTQTLNNLQELLTETSREFHALVDGKATIESVYVIVPDSWMGTDCLRGKNLTDDIFANVNDEDIFITKKHPIFGDLPMTEQFGQCGVPGRRIDIPYTALLMQRRPLNESSQVRNLLFQWISYRFGIFHESGFEGDRRYPLYSSEGDVRLMNKGCSGDKVICTGQDKYDKDVTTKQNILCNGRSGMEVIEASGELSNDTVPFVKPEFRFVTRRDTLLVLILDRTHPSRWDVLQRALFQFISRLPLGAYLSVITYGDSDATLNLPPTVITESNQEGLHGRIPRRALINEKPNTCLSCGLEMAMKVSKKATATSKWILASNTNTLLQRIEEIDAIRASNIPIYAVSTTPDAYMQDLTSNHFVVEPELSKLSDVFNTILRMTTGSQLVSFHKEFLIAGDKDRTLNGNFVVEEKLRQNLWIQVTAEDERDIELFEVLSPTGKRYSFPSFQHSLAYFHLQDNLNEAGIWSYSIKLYQTLNALYPVHVEVLGEPNDDDAILLDSWITIDETQEIPMVFLYARVEQGSLPVLDANVKAYVYPPKNDDDGKGFEVILRDSGTGYPDITQGDGIYSAYFTDFATVSGYYRMTVVADHNSGNARTPKLSSALNDFDGDKATITCCGSVVSPVSYTVPTNPFHRSITTTSFYVQQAANFYARQGSNGDFFPPSRITDFALDTYNSEEESLFVNLKWTAPGNDYDKGTAFRYEIRCYTSREALRDENFNEMSIPVHATLIPTPEVYGTEQTCTVGVPWPNEVFYYAIVAFDEAGNRGRISNTISVFIKEEVSTTLMGDFNDHNGVEIEDEEAAFYSGERLEDNIMTYLIAGIVSLILVLVIIGAVLGIRKYYKILSQTKDVEAPNTTTTSSLSGTLKKIISLPDVTPEKEQKWSSSSNYSGDSCHLKPLPSISETVMPPYYRQGLQKATSQEIPGVHRIIGSESSRTTSQSTECYDESDESAENHNLLVAPPPPRISVLEDYSVYRDLSNLSTKSNFSIGQLPPEIQNGVFVTVPPYTDVNSLLDNTSKKSRHESLV